MKKLAKRFAVLCILLPVCMISTSCSDKKEYDTITEQNQEVDQAQGQDQKVDKYQGQEQDKITGEASKNNSDINSDNASGMIINTTVTPLPKEVSESEDEISMEFLQNFYDFTEQTSAPVFRDNVSENQIYAPLNWYLALSTLGELSDGDAREEIQGVLGISDTKINMSEVNTAVSTLEKRRINLGKLSINNSLWLNDKINYQEELLTKLQSQYRTEVYKGNLKDPKFQNNMANWVSENTNYEFKPDYNSSINLADQYAFISLNTLDFYNEWLFPFEEEETTKELFFLNDNSEITCDFMKMEKQAYPFMVGEDYISTICLLKENEAMLFILPEEGLVVEDLLEERGKLSGILSDCMKNQFTLGKVKFSVPKFTYAGEINLKTTAEAMGIKRIFDSNAKAFSEFTDENVYISDITQASKIAINEKGCSASSYTEIRAQSSGVGKDEAEINLNRPFIYVLYKDKIPFLVGIVRNPLAK